MSGYVVWLTGDRSRMDALAETLRSALGQAVPSIDVFTEEMVEQKLCAVESRGVDFGDVVVRRLGWLGHLLARNGCAVVAVSVSGRREIRDEIRAMAGGRMIEVLVEGETPEGYEPPHYPEVEWPAGESPDAVSARVRDALIAAGLLDAAATVYSAEEEARVKERLEKLGYM